MKAYSRIAAMALAALPASALAQGQNFFEGKTITFYVGLSAGGGYDTNARVVARHMDKHIPGKPTIVVRNMPGGGGLVMTNFVSNVAAKDGLHIGVPQRGVPFEPLTGSASQAKFDPLKLNWIGSTNSDTSVTIVHSRTGIKTWRDLLEREVVIGATGIGTESVTVPNVLRNLLGFRFRVIAGYPGGNDVNLAMQRGEVDGRATFSWTSLKPRLKEWIDSGEYVILYQMALKPHQDIPKIPLVLDLAKDPETRRILELQFAAYELGRPKFVADGVPADRVNILRRSFDATMKDEALLAEAEKSGLEINPVTGEEMQKVLNEVYSAPKELIARLTEALKPPSDLKVIKRERAKKPN